MYFLCSCLLSYIALYVVHVFQLEVAQIHLLKLPRLMLRSLDYYHIIVTYMDNYLMLAFLGTRILILAGGMEIPLLSAN